VSKPKPGPRDQNRILASLSAADHRRILVSLEPVTLRRREPLYEPGEPVTHVFFPRTAVASIVTRMAEGGTIEVATIGNEGVVGLHVLFGNGNFPMDIFVQIPGEAARMDVRAFRRELASGGGLAVPVSRYAQALFVQVGQTAACNRVHSIEQRCARWLLMSHDRVLGDRISLTQEFLAEMLGVRRAGVTAAAGSLRKRKLIAYRRGEIRILDRKGLEHAACECYRFIRSEHEREVG
jgi:CRP-like cAMP-binding protein